MEAGVKDTIIETGARENPNITSNKKRKESQRGD